MFAGMAIRKRPLTDDCWLCGEAVRMPIAGTTITCPACDVRWEWSSLTPQEWQMMMERLASGNHHGYLKYYGGRPDEPEDLFDHYIDHGVVHVPVPA